ncbi:MAG: response regulator, partial [Pseudomonadales bacterium]|nr:response regulator [Pseudomonadales bacterium]
MTEQRDRILIVDDERISIKAISACLEDDYQIMAATSYPQVMKAVNSNTPPDLILLDVMMPDLDGFEICKRLKADPIAANIPVIFLTAKAHDRDEARGLELGAVDYIGKPVIPAIVRARVKAQIDLRRYLAELEQAYTTIEIQRDRMEEELQVAQQLQQSLLPKFKDQDESVSVHASMRSAREVSGDFYDAFYIGRHHLCICIGDVAGKGVPAALFMGITKALVRAKAGFRMSTAAIVTEVNSELLKNNDACMFVTLFVAVLEIKTGRLSTSDAAAEEDNVEAVGRRMMK